MKKRLKKSLKTIKPDGWIILVVGVLVFLGLMFIMDTCAVTRISGSGFKYMRVLRQLGFAVFGAGLCYGISLLDLRVFRGITLIYSIAVIVLLLIVLKMGGEVKGASRWLNFGAFGLQPSELAKIAVIFCMAWVVNESRAFHYKIWNDHRYLSKRSMWILFVCISGALVLLVGGENMSGGIILLVTIIGMLAFGGLPWKYIGGIVVAGGVGALIFLLAGKGFRMARIEAFKNPLEHMNDIGAQVVHSLIAISSGGWLGKGFGNGTGKSIIPEPDNDYIFPTIVEEWGFLGGLIFIVLYAIIIWRGILIIQECRNLYGRMLVMGALIVLTIQMFINMAVCLHIIPVTGVCLPFVSYGGSSIIASFAMIGIILSVSRQVGMPNAKLMHPVPRIDYEKPVRRSPRQSNGFSDD